MADVLLDSDVVLGSRTVMAERMWWMCSCTQILICDSGVRDSYGGKNVVDVFLDPGLRCGSGFRGNYGERMWWMCS